MSNPNWPSFPGLQNLTQDGDGRPQVLDLIPGRQRGTPLNTLLFNPLIRSICDLRDDADMAVSGVHGASLGNGDYRGSGLFWQGSTNLPCFIHEDGTGRTIYTGLAVDGDIRSALNSESIRAQNAEATKLSGVIGAALGAGDIQGVSVFFQGSSGQPCFTYVDGNGKLMYVGLITPSVLSAILKGYQPVGDYATNAALNSESIRAQNAEATKLSGVIGAALGAGDIQGVSVFFQGSSGQPCFTYVDGNGKLMYVGLITPSVLSAILKGYQPVGDYATNAALNNGLAAVLSKAGGTLTGDVVIDNDIPYGPWAGTPKRTFSVGGGALTSWGQVDGGGNLRLIVGGNNPGQPYRNWVFDPTAGTITSPGANAVPEVVGPSGRVVDQAFVVTGFGSGGPLGEAWVSFPIPFKEGTTPVVTPVINREPGAVSRAVAFGNVGNSNQPNVTNTGFSFQPWYATGGNIGASGQAWTLHVRAIGVV